MRRSIRVPQRPVALSPNSAAFLGFDTGTQGNWWGAYGSDGYLIPDPTFGFSPESGATFLLNKPSYATFGTTTGRGVFTWNNNDSSSNATARAVQYPGGSGSRIASTWYTTGTTTTFDLNITGGAAKIVRIYALDWDASGRAANFNIQDADDFSTLDGARNVSSAYVNGVWLSWRIKGHVLINMTLASGPNATMSGFFFDP